MIVSGLLAKAGAFLTAVLVGNATLPRTASSCVDSRWVDALWPDPAAVAFKPTTDAERETVQRLVRDLVQLAPRKEPLSESLVQQAESAGFQLESWMKGDEIWWALRESADQRRGAGAYVIRTGAATQDVVQSPHVYFDLATERIGLGLFACAPSGYRPRVFMTNTAHRYRSRPGERRHDKGEHPADVAHNPKHLFHGVTEALAMTLPKLRVFQLHGFEADAKNSMKMVVSAGARDPSPLTQLLVNRLTGLWGDGVRLFPSESERLGGTQNVQGALLRTIGGTQFVHLEMSARVRRELLMPERVRAFAKTLFTVEEG